MGLQFPTNKGAMINFLCIWKDHPSCWKWGVDMNGKGGDPEARTHSPLGPPHHHPGAGSPRHWRAARHVTRPGGGRSPLGSRPGGSGRLGRSRSARTAQTPHPGEARRAEVALVWLEPWGEFVRRGEGVMSSRLGAVPAVSFSVWPLCFRGSAVEPATRGGPRFCPKSLTVGSYQSPSQAPPF